MIAGPGDRVTEFGLPAHSDFFVAVAALGTCSRIGERLANPGSTARLVSRLLPLPRRAPPPSITSGDFARRELVRCLPF